MANQTATVKRIISARFSSLLGAIIFNVKCTDDVDREVVQWDDQSIIDGAEFDISENDRWLKMDSK